MDSNVDSHESTTNNKRTFSIRLNRVDVSDAAPELHVVDSDDETPNDSTASQPAASDVIMDEYNDKVTSTQIASDTKFFPSSDSSDESDGEYFFRLQLNLTIMFGISFFFMVSDKFWLFPAIVIYVLALFHWGELFFIYRKSDPLKTEVR